MLNWHEELIKLRRLEIEEDRQILLKRSLPAEKIIDSRKNKRIITPSSAKKGDDSNEL
tara:strand:+ start:4823 stop:4996 length:174 start_codon:yes stop_codon:yes gene_type:complete